jgi:hypothetical protein
VCDTERCGAQARDRDKQIDPSAEAKQNVSNHGDAPDLLATFRAKSMPETLGILKLQP